MGSSKDGWETVEEDGWEVAPDAGSMSDEEITSKVVSGLKPKPPGMLDTAAMEFTQGAGKEWADEGATKLYGAREYMRNLFGGQGFGRAAEAAKESQAPFQKMVREDRDLGRKANPKIAAAFNTAGDLASDWALRLMTFGASDTPAGQAILGGITGAGASDEPLFSTKTGLMTAGGAGMGLAFGKLGKRYPKATSAVLSMLGLGAAGLGGIQDSEGKPIMDEADRWQMGGTGAAGAVSAISSLVHGAGKGAGKVAKGALEQLETPLRAKDVGVAEELNAANDAKSALLDKATSSAGKEKIAKFKKRLLGKKQELKADDKAVRQAFKESLTKEAAENKATVEAFQASERGPAPAAGASPDEIAAFEASIPARVQGKQDADYQAVLNRYQTQKSLGHEIDPEVETRVQAIIDRYEKNSPGFYKRFLYDWEQNGAKHQADLMAELNAMKGGSAAGPRPTTAVGIPSAAKADTQVSGRPTTKMQPPPELAKAQQEAAQELDIPFVRVKPGTEEYPELFAKAKADVDSENLHVKNLLGLEEPEFGFQPEPARLLSDKEKDIVAKNTGVLSVNGEPMRFSRPPDPPSDARMRNAAEVDAFDRGSNLPPEPGTPGLAPDRKSKVGDTPGEGYKPEFFTESAPDPDFLDSPISNADWARINKTPSSPAEPREPAPMFWEKSVPVEAPSTNTPRAERHIAENAPALKQKVKDAAKLGALSGGAAMTPAGMLLHGVSGAAEGVGLGSVSGAVGNVGRLMVTDPAARAYVMGKIERMLTKAPQLSEKYGRFLTTAAQGPAAGLSARLVYLLQSSPEFAAAWERTE